MKTAPFAEPVSRAELSGEVTGAFHRWLTLLLVIGFAFALPSSLDAQEPVAANLYQLPSSQSAQRTLAKDALFLWDQRPLREGLSELGETYAIGVWIDRRVDPGQLVSYRVKARSEDRSLGGNVKKLAASIGAEAVLVENVIYVAPSGIGSRVQRAAVEFHAALAARQARSISAANDPALASTAAINDPSSELRMLAWRELATPTEIVQSIAQEWSIQFAPPASGELLPHDLLHQGALPRPCTLATQLSIVACGFDLEPHPTETGAIELRQMQPLDNWTGSYGRQELNGAMMQAGPLAQLKRDFPGSQFRSNDAMWQITGPSDLHLRLLAPQAATRRPVNIERQPLSFEVINKPAKVVIDSLAASIGFDVTWDETCTASDQSQLITFTITNTRLDGLLAAFGEAAGLDVERQGLDVTISK